MSSKSKGVVDDAELAVLSEDQLRELAEFIDPDVSDLVLYMFVCVCVCVCVCMHVSMCEHMYIHVVYNM